MGEYETFFYKKVKKVKFGFSKKSFEKKLDKIAISSFNLPDLPPTCALPAVPAREVRS